MSAFQCLGGFLLSLKLNKRKVSSDSHIQNLPIWLKMLLNVTDPCVNWVKVNDKQGFGRPCVCWWLVTAGASFSLLI